MDYLFVYGTLLRNLNNHMSAFLKQNATYVGHGYIRGQLFNLGHYPAAVLSQAEGDRVYGNIYLIKDYEKVFQVLDDYEEVGDAYPQPNEYRREMTSAYLSGQQNIECWIYLYNHSTANLQRIVSGDYLGSH